MFNLLRRKIALIICPEIQTERRALLRDIETDPLTGLANGRAFKKATATANADGAVEFILFDANNFGQVNKIHGHETGDRLLQQIGKAIEQAANGNARARAFHLHGDEFAIIAPTGAGANIRNRAEMFFGRQFVAFGVYVSISGTVGATLDEADKTLQRRKKEQKAI